MWEIGGEGLPGSLHCGPQRQRPSGRDDNSGGAADNALLRLGRRFGRGDRRQGKKKLTQRSQRAQSSQRKKRKRSTTEVTEGPQREREIRETVLGVKKKREVNPRPR